MTGYLLTARLSDDDLLITQAMLGTRDLPPVIPTDALVGLSVDSRIVEGPDGSRVVEIRSQSDPSIGGVLTDYAELPS